MNEKRDAEEKLNHFSYRAWQLLRLARIELDLATESGPSWPRINVGWQPTITSRKILFIGFTRGPV